MAYYAISKLSMWKAWRKTTTCETVNGWWSRSKKTFSLRADCHNNQLQVHGLMPRAWNFIWVSGPGPSAASENQKWQWKIPNKNGGVNGKHTCKYMPCSIATFDYPRVSMGGNPLFVCADFKWHWASLNGETWFASMTRLDYDWDPRDVPSGYLT